VKTIQTISLRSVSFFSSFFDESQKVLCSKRDKNQSLQYPCRCDGFQRRYNPPSCSRRRLRSTHPHASGGFAADTSQRSPWRNSEPYQLLNRLLGEQCEFTDGHLSDEQSSKVQVQKQSEGETLQSPYDPDRDNSNLLISMKNLHIAWNTSKTHFHHKGS
jgi:hypothetical protein